LSERELPKKWYNIIADLPWPLPPYIDPETHTPISPEKLAVIFPPALLEQEVSDKRWIPIPEEVLEALLRWRPSPLVRATALEEYLDTPARIYYKNEAVSPPGSHKPNTAVAQAYFNKKAGINRLTTETGAGQWGSALSFACCLFDMECKVYMVRISYDQKPYRRTLMQTWGGVCVPSPSNETQSGRAVLAKDPNCSGSLCIAISEAVEVAAQNPDTNYSLGSVLNHVLLHQTIIGLETEKQLKKADEKPDVMIGCCGGGSNFAGMVFPFIRRKFDGENIRFVGTEPTACPTMTRGQYRYDFGDTSMMTPLIKMLTLGHSFVPSGIHAGGLRYHGMSPLVSLLADKGVIEAKSYHQNSAFEAAVTFARTEGILPAPETAHAIRAAIDEALRCKEDRKQECIVFNFSGHGHFDLGSYEKYLGKQLEDFEHPTEAIDKAIAELPTL
jgi:tryptophan synthase beta chain